MITYTTLNSVDVILMYSAESWSITKEQERKLEEMKMLRWMGGITKRDKMRNYCKRRSVKCEGR